MQPAVMSACIAIPLRQAKRFRNRGRHPWHGLSKQQQYSGRPAARIRRREYCMLAYVPSNSNLDGKFHAISVRVRDGKSAIGAKRGYWATAMSNWPSYIGVLP
jgi:hypothetical protein